MSNLRPVLFITLIFLGYMLWINWQKDYGPQPATPAATAEPVADIPAPATNGAGNSAVPDAGDLPSEDLPAAEPGQTAATPQAEMSAPRQMVTIETDVLRLEVDLVGGTVVSAKLLDYPVEQKEPDNPVQLLGDTGEDVFIAQSGLLSNSSSAPNHTTQYQTNQMAYRLSDGAAELRVPFTWRSDDGITVSKTFVLKPGSYDIQVTHTVNNNSGNLWVGNRYDQLQRGLPANEESVSFTDPSRISFRGIGFYSPDEKFEKIDFDDVDDGYKQSFANGWLSMVQHYFFAAWIPPQGQTNAYSTQVYSPYGLPRYIARAVSPSVQVPAGQQHNFSSQLYLGPKLQDHLNEIAPGLRHTVDYGIFTVISTPLYWLLSKIHGVVGNWGWAIVFLTVLIKLLFFKLTEAQFKSMARMRKLQPRIEALKERFGDDRQKMSQAMMEMYRKEKVNPLGGCLPILVQIPIFIALYWVLLESVELRQAPFIGWIQNLSARDPYFILPALNAVFMILTQRLTPTAGMDPMQRKIMNFMPVAFSIMFAFFPAGLVLYWATNAGLSLLQQWYITRKIAATD